MKRLASALLLAGLSTNALAHFPVMECWQSNGTIRCQAGWTDGGAAQNYPVTLYDYDDNVVAETMTDAKSMATFSAPEGDYYLLYDPAHETTIEVDGLDIPER